jgi:hypothetical protein
MKTSQLAALSAAALAMCTLVSTRAKAQATNPSIPVGTLSAFPTVVQTGTKPTLTWSINYPSIVEDFVVVTPPGTVTPKENLVCRIRMLGLGVTSKGSNGSITFYRTRGRIRYNGSTNWSDIYDGKQTDTKVQQQQIVKTYTVNKDKPMDFGGQYYYNNEWSTFYSSLSGDNVRTLVNGAIPPSNVPDYNAPSLESFLRPYLDATGKVKIGPMDVIVFMELTHSSSQKSNIGYDLQDCVMLITYSKT